ncbi:MAG TPA: bifunctional methylenetetrahydrofolate dehydrogenase/methenyltetrahydrofolate cyclohydrolase FolD [bacterium]|nr:bifunctional methylenetetrahydrofolate dehydrogenase/methenyltetrahydrofolate cyclohydrolase FolD [bacterium]
MVAIILDGKRTAQEIQKELSLKVKEEGIIPGVAVIRVGEDPSSLIYIRNKKKRAEEVGIYFEEHTLKENTSQDELIELIKKLNSNSRIDGIVLQLPLPKHLDEKRMLEKISPEKDVDGFHPLNMGRLLKGNPLFIPATPRGIMELLSRYLISLKGKRVVVVGRSNIVGKPLALLFLKEDATVAICHSKTKDLDLITKEADILVVAIGKPEFIREGMVKENSVVIDVGINRVGNRIMGDVDFKRIKEKVSHITPVPGGVGPMTIIMLLKNVIEAAESRKINAKLKQEK